MASELAKKAAEAIARDEGWLPTDDPTSVANIIDTHGVLVSHEDAELLRQLRRVPQNREVRLVRITVNAGEFWYVTLVKQNESKVTNHGFGLHEILKQSLDEAGVTT